MHLDDSANSSASEAVRALVALSVATGVLVAGALFLFQAAGVPRPGAVKHALPDVGAAALLTDPGDALAPDAIDVAGDLSPPLEAFPPRQLLGSDTAPPPIAVAYAGDVSLGPHPVLVEIEAGEAFVDALRRAGVRAEDRNSAAAAFGKHFNMRRFRPGQELSLTVSEPNRTLFQLVSNGHDVADDAYLMALEYRIDPANRLSLVRNPDGVFDATATTVLLEKRIVAAKGDIEGSLFLSATKAGMPDKIVADLANIFSYDVDFQRDVMGSDQFEAVYETLYDERGEEVGVGDIIYGRLNWRGRSKEKGYYRFQSAEGGTRADYFDATGQSAKRLLMKTPIDGARLSSGFGTRKHPILGYQKAHKGVDFAANTGTPIKAAGSGTIERAGPFGTFGNYIKIRHANGYKTAYAHLSRIKKGIRTGARVNQGDIIGYVGTTGRSTGPHLHYEVHLNNVQVNPQKLKIATGISLGGKELERFKKVRDEIDAMRNPVPVEPVDLVADRGIGKAL